MVLYARPRASHADLRHQDWKKKKKKKKEKERKKKKPGAESINPMHLVIHHTVCQP
jgi:hypothetical protein